MDLIQSNLFWTDVGLAVASKLAIVATMLWILKMALDARTTVRASIPEMTFEAVAVAQQTPRPRFQASEVIPRNEGSAGPPNDIEDRAVPRPVAHKPAKADHKRDELLAFIAQRTQGRGHDERQ